MKTSHFVIAVAALLCASALPLAGCGGRSVVNLSRKEAGPRTEAGTSKKDIGKPTETGYEREAGAGGQVCKGTCSSKADCPSGSLDCVSGSCVYCKVDSDCTYGLKKCDTATGICKYCATDQDCIVSGVKILTGKCHPAMSQCFACSSDAECQSVSGGVYKYCGASGSCVTCKTNGECAPKNGSTSICASSAGIYSGLCYGCTNAIECQTAFGTGNHEIWTCK